MTTRENKELYRSVVEDLNRGDLEASLAFTAPDATLNGQPRAARATGTARRYWLRPSQTSTTTYRRWSPKRTGWLCAGG
jgi:hypothetical protein